MFQFEVIYDDRDLRVLGKTERKRRNSENIGSLDGLFSVYSIIFGITFLFIGFFGSRMTWDCFFLLLGLVLIFTPTVVHYFRDTPDKDAVMGYGTKMTFKIEDGEFWFRAEGEEVFSYYCWGVFDEKCYICEGRYVFLWWDEPYGFVLPKRSITAGNSYDFEAYLKKCGVKLKYVI